jgi:hypothetical protein
MKKLFALTAIFALVLAGCGDEDSTNNSTNNDNNGNTSLKIQNESFSEITDVRWSSVTFVQGTDAIRNGSHITKNVQDGNGYIYFKRKTNPINVRTDQSVVVEKNEQKVFVITDNTLVVDVDNPSSKGTLGTISPTSLPFNGTWGDSYGEVVLNLGNETWTFVLGPNYYTGTYTQQGSILTLRRSDNVVFGTVQLGQNELRLYVSFEDNEGYPISGSWDLTKGATFQKDAKLTIRNDSFYNLVYLYWNNEMIFPSLLSSRSDTINVNANSGYMSFYISYETNWIECRTNDLITVSEGDTKIFAITNTTLVVALDDETETPKTLEAIATSMP